MFCLIVLRLLTLQLFIKLICKIEDDDEPECANGNQNQPIVKRCKFLERNQGNTVNNGENTNASSDYNRRNKPGKLHLQRSRKHGKCLIGKCGKEHHQGEIYLALDLQKLNCLFAILLAKKLDTDTVTAESTEQIHNKACNHHADKANQERFPRLGIERSAQNDKRHRNTRQNAKQNGEHDL